MNHPPTMTDAQVISWLKKTTDTIITFVGNGGTIHTDRGSDLADRFNSLSDEAKERDIWYDYLQGN